MQRQLPASESHFGSDHPNQTCSEAVQLGSEKIKSSSNFPLAPSSKSKRRVQEIHVASSFKQMFSVKLIENIPPRCSHSHKTFGEVGVVAMFPGIPGMGLGQPPSGTRCKGRY